MTRKVPVTALVLTKNEELAVAGCLDSLAGFDQVILVDSLSSDRTLEIAESREVEILHFDWNGDYPKKKEWSAAHPAVRHDWVLHVDADERVTAGLEREIRQLIEDGHDELSAVDIQLEYWFGGRPLRHGHRVSKRALVRRDRVTFPHVGDIGARGANEIEGHYQPQIMVGRSVKASNKLVHHDPDPIGSWISRHNRYADWEAYLAVNPEVALRVNGARSRQGRIFRTIPAKPLAFFFYSFVARLGFLDGRAGFDYAMALSFYYWLTAAKVRELRRNES